MGYSYDRKIAFVGKTARGLGPYRRVDPLKAQPVFKRTFQRYAWVGDLIEAWQLSGSGWVGPPWVFLAEMPPKTSRPSRGQINLFERSPASSFTSVSGAWRASTTGTV